MARYEHSIDVHVPVRTAYHQWTQFDSFPAFMEGVKEVRQITDRQLFWHVEIAGNDKAWYAEITEQSPDERIAWTSRVGAKHAAVVTFQRIDPETTRVILQIDYEPSGFIENAGAALGVVKKRTVSDLERFKTFIEAQGAKTDAWRRKAG